jgi:hypothetical protein
VKEQRIVRKIENQASKFKQRAHKSPQDGKRHDQVRRDEKKWMWTAYNKLGWSFAKIGSVFNRDPRSTKEAIETYKPTGQQTAETVQHKAESVGEDETKRPENKRPLPVLMDRGVLELAATFKENLSRIDALDGAVYQLSGDPWPTDIPSVLHVSHYPELKVVLAVEHDQPGQFLLLMEEVEAILPGFGKDFRDWECQSLTPLIRRGQDVIREIWQKAREGTGLEMSFDREYILPHEYGLLLNVPLFVYRFALKHCAESNPPDPELELNPADIDRFPDLPPHYRQLTSRGEPDLLLAAGAGRVVDSHGIPMDVMDLCKRITTELCQLYAQDGRIREIVREQKALQKKREPFLKALSEFLGSFSG